MEHTQHLYQIIWQSRPLMQAAEDLVAQGLQGTGLSVRTRAVMEMLLQFGPLTVPDLAQKLEIQRQYVQQMVNETLHEGLTQRQTNPRHKRSPLIALTDAGHEMIAQVIANEETVVAGLATGFNPQDVETTLRVTQALVAKLKTAKQKAAS